MLPPAVARHAVILLEGLCVGINDRDPRAWVPREHFVTREALLVAFLDETALVPSARRAHEAIPHGNFRHLLQRAFSLCAELDSRLGRAGPAHPDAIADRSCVSVDVEADDIATLIPRRPEPSERTVSRHQRVGTTHSSGSRIIPDQLEPSFR